jgi:hypothetical protein
MPIQQKIIEVAQNNRGKIINGLLIVGGTYLVYRFGKKIIGDINKGAAQSQADDKPSVRQAMNFRSGLNRSGVSWLVSTDGTNEKLIFDTARTVTDLDEVSKNYKDLYQSNLLDDLQRELSSDDYSKLLTIVSTNPNKNTKKGGAAPITFAKKSNLVIAKKEVTIRKSPDASNHGAFYEMFSENNIIRKAQSGEFIGYATGNQHFDEVNNVKFIEVGYVVNGAKAPSNLKSKDKQKYLFWVSASSNYVEIFDFYKPMFDRYPASEKLTPWMKPLDYFEGGDKTVKGISSTKIITQQSAQVLDDKFRVIAVVTPNTFLGTLIMSLDTGKGIFHRFKTVDNTERWVNARLTKRYEA